MFAELNPIGIEESTIVGWAQMTASSKDSGTQAYHARINYGTYYWSPADDQDEGWLQILPDLMWTYYRVATQVRLSL